MYQSESLNSERSLISLDGQQLPPFSHGKICFEDGHQRLRSSCYVRIHVDTDIEDVIKFIALKWLKRSPKIIIPIITGLSHFKTWKNQKQLNKFKRGIIKAAYTTELVYITNGYNVGVSKLIGDAFREESLARRTCNDVATTSCYANENLDEFDKLILIGVVSTSNLKHADLLKGCQSTITYKIDEQEAAANTHCLNPDHTHFILVDDDNAHIKLLKFRVALEKRLQKRIFGRRSKPTSSAQAQTGGGGVGGGGGDSAAASPNFNIITTDTNSGDHLANASTCSMSNDDKIPVVALLIGGGVGSVSLVLTKIYQGIPILIFKGTGHAPDLISGTYEDFAEGCDNLSDNHLRTAITLRISEKFPKECKDDSTRNRIKDSILQIIKCANTQEYGNLLTFIDSTSVNSELDDLDKYILISLLKSQPNNQQSKELLKKNLMLILDWNRPDIALSEIFQHDNCSYKLDVDKSMLEKSLLKKNREEFVEIFLDQGFQIHRFLNHIKMFLLFERCEDREFFLTVCIEKGLGTKLTQEDFDAMRSKPALLFQTYINPLVKKLSDIDELFQVLEMSLNALKLYIDEAGEFTAERKAIVYLIVFAVLLKRHKLAKILWKRTDQPIGIALLCSMIYKRLSLLCHENYIKSELEEYSKDFACCAIGVLDLSFSQSDLRVYDVLNRKDPNLNDLTVIELAYNSDNKDFLSHPCCQKWITNKFNGSISVREFNLGMFEMPTWTKILSSAFLIFPIYLWIDFPTTARRGKKTSPFQSGQDNEKGLDSEIDDQDDQDEEKMIRTELMNISNTKNAENEKKKKNEMVQMQLPLWEKIFLLWSAPITKFWINLLFYMIYLTLFGLAVLWPSCGNLIVDAVVWLWTAVICCETSRRTYNKYVMCSNLPIRFSCLEIIIMLAFLTLYLFIRILGMWHFDVLTSKAILCLGLIYFYYRSVFVYLPISPTLGPMLVKMNYMVRIDFITFLRMFILFMAAGGITINAIVYPYYPLNSELLKRVFLRSFFGLFVTEKDDLNGKDASGYARTCQTAVSHSSEYCENILDRVSFNRNGTSKPAEFACPHASAVGWAILIQYLLLVKLFLTTLLTAMFSHTKAKVDAESDQIWMFQRYEIVIDYEQRLRLPPPLTIISYVIMLCEWLFHRLAATMRLYKLDNKFLNSLKRRKKSSGAGVTSGLANENKYYPTVAAAAAAAATSPPMPSNGTTVAGNSSLPSKKQIDHSLYWKTVVQDFAKKLEKETIEKDPLNKQAIGLFRLREEFQSHKKNIKRLDDRMVSVERNLTSVQVTAEYLKYFLTNKDSTGLKSMSNDCVHMMARQSPYPFTVLSRFPVFDKYVSWETRYDSYDPTVIFVEPHNLNFKRDELVFVDPCELDLIELQPNVIQLKPVHHHRSNLSSAHLKKDAFAAQQTTSLSSWSSSSAATSGAGAEADKSINVSSSAATITTASSVASTITATASATATASLDSSASMDGATTTNTTMTAEATTDGRSKDEWNVMESEIDLLNTILNTQLDEDTPCTFSTRTQARLVEHWNKATHCLINSKRVLIDRRSWIVKNDRPIEYTSDTMGFPMNPMGRTGARGRGALWRFGPNHMIVIIVSRWRKQSNNLNEFMNVDGRRMIEFLACKDIVYGEWKLPDGKIFGNVNQYNVACTCFIDSIFESTPVERQKQQQQQQHEQQQHHPQPDPPKSSKNAIMSEEDMKAFFASFAKETLHDSSGTSSQTTGTSAGSVKKFVAKKLYKGYIDDPRNTDSAWIEAEIWNFHYGGSDKLDEIIPNASSKWKTMSSHVRLFGNQNLILKEVASMYQAYF